MTFTELKEKMAEARQEAQREAQAVCPCVRSRGAWLMATKDDETITENDSYEIKSLNKLLKDIQELKEQGADNFYIDGGFDGADNVRDLNDCYDPWVSDWSIELELVE